MPLAKPPAVVALASADDTEQQFYEALQQGDIERLMAVWSDDDDIVCVHPGGPRVLGAAAIRSMFEKLFANGSVDAHPQKVRRVLAPSSAVHSVVERVQVMTEQGPQSAWMLATNVYVKTAQGWRLVAHHASPGSTRELQETTEVPATLH